MTICLVLLAGPEACAYSWYVATTGDDLIGDGSPQNPFATIQRAVNEADNRHLVIVADGVYTGDGNRDIDLLGKSITVRSLNGPLYTTIDCGGNTNDFHNGFYLTRGEDESTVIDGFTIHGGYASMGAAVYCQSSSPRITNCVFRENTAVISGGAMRCKSCTPTVSHCTFYGNSAPTGAAVFCIASGSPHLNNCVVACSAGGAAIDAYEATSQPLLVCCDVYGNGGGDWTTIEDQAGANGNMSADPSFCEPAAGDFRISSTSPCAPENNDCGTLVGALGVGCTHTDVTVPEKTLPTEFFMNQNYPNPFNTSTTIEFGLPMPAYLALIVYNILGQRVATFGEGVLPPGFYSVRWSGLDDRGQPVSSGVYFFTLCSGEYKSPCKMLLIR
ncbi:MAG: DUF1565 domain-containing protein [candidate division Zixibacteria bacterium]|nr:DUF1565 domain-containing protein [candidate division Zixibacteria bacterium]